MAPFKMAMTFVGAYKNDIRETKDIIMTKDKVQIKVIQMSAHKGRRLLFGHDNNDMNKKVFKYTWKK